MKDQNNSYLSVEGEYDHENILQTFLQEINRYDLLSEEETLRLARLVQDHDDEEAFQKLITANLRLVIKIAQDFRKYWMDGFLDLVQEGNIGLAKAVRKFDPDREVKFSYYASFWIRAYIMKSTMENKRLVKIGTTQAQRKLFFSLNKEMRKWQNSGLEPDPEVIAKNLNVDVDSVIEMVHRLNGSEVSIHLPIGDDKKTSLGDMMADNGPSVEEISMTSQERETVRRIISDHMSSFNEKEKAIIVQRLLSDDSETLKGVADQFDVSRERIRQIEVALMGKLKDIFRSEMQDRVAA